MLPKCNHYVGTAHGISTLCYGSENYYLGGTGQGKVFSGNVCRDVSCLIFKHPEQKDLVVLITSEARKEVYKRVLIAFVDDSDFYFWWNR